MFLSDGSEGSVTIVLQQVPKELQLKGSLHNLAHVCFVNS